MPPLPCVASVTLVLPSRAPDLLARWYSQNLGFEASGGCLHSGPLVLDLVETEPATFERARLRLTLESLGAVVEVHSRLEASGAVVSPISGTAARAVVRVVDPEGNVLEIDHA